MKLDDLSQINKVIGNIRVTMFMVSYLGTAVIGAILDKTKKFKLITLINSATFLLSYVRVFNKKIIEDTASPAAHQYIVIRIFIDLC